MPEPRTIYDLVQTHGQCRPTATAIEAPGRVPLTYRALANQIDATIRALMDFGIGPSDRVAAALPSGPEAAVAFLAIAAGAAYAPLSPALTAREFAESLPVPTTKALVLLADTVSPARDVARERGIPILELIPAAGSAAGAFHLTGDASRPAAAGGVAGPRDIGLVLRSSGTTARPKVFAYTQTRLLARAREKAEVTEVTPADRGLNLPPLFHANGLGSVLCSLHAGASLICVPGLRFPEFFTWLAELQPTWYSGLPAMHQAILDQVRLAPEVIAHHSLRFARSGSAPLSARLQQDWEAAFDVPLIDIVSSTEAGNIARTPPPPRIRKKGAIGVAMPWVAVIDDQGTVVPANALGEIAVPASRVIRPDDATPDEFPVVNGYYQTGDLGYLDEERYLYLVGRAKELINRGGEKVAPQEVEEQLRRHPAVAQAAVFALPDPTLGQQVAAAVVLRPDRTATGEDLRAFVAPRLAHFKVPRVVLIVAHIPVNAVGKVQRLALAELLQVELDRHLQPPPAGSDVARVVIPPRDALEQRLVDLWQSLLNVQPIGIADDFFALGGDSLAAVRLLTELDREFGVTLSEAVLSGVSTIDGLAAVLRDTIPTAAPAPLVPLKRQGSRPPLFICLHGHPNSALAYRPLIRHTPADQPLIGVRMCDTLPGSAAPQPIDEVAAEGVRAIRAAQPRGPYYLLGHSQAGLVALEVARQLIAAHHPVAFLGLLDTAYPTDGTSVPWDSYDPHFVRRHLRRLVTLGVRASVPYLAERARWFVHRSETRLRTRFHHVVRQTRGPARWLPPIEQPLPTKPSSTYPQRPYPGKITLFMAADPPRDLELIAEVGWKRVAAGGFETRTVPGDHDILLKAQNGKPLAQIVDECLRRAQRDPHSIIHGD